VAKPGFTDFAIYIYDQNGLLDFVCEKLFDRQVEYIDLQTWGYVSNGFKGSAVISATFWEHDVFDPDGKFVRNLVGLGAVMVERTGTRLGEDIPGDEAAGDRGIPFAAAELGKNWCPGGATPRCPGQPIFVFDETVENFNFTGSNNTFVPYDDNTLQAVSAITIGGVPANCSVTDVNATINVTEGFGNGIFVDLSHGAVNNSMMFDTQSFGFCSPLSIGAIMDDDATVRLADHPDCTEPYGQGAAFKTDSAGLDAFDGELAAGAWTLRSNDVWGTFDPQYGIRNWSLGGTCEAVTRTRRMVP